MLDIHIRFIKLIQMLFDNILNYSYWAQHNAEIIIKFQEPLLTCSYLYNNLGVKTKHNSFRKHIYY